MFSTSTVVRYFFLFFSLSFSKEVPCPSHRFDILFVRFARDLLGRMNNPHRISFFYRAAYLLSFFFFFFFLSLSFFLLFFFPSHGTVVDCLNSTAPPVLQLLSPRSFLFSDTPGCRGYNVDHTTERRKAVVPCARVEKIAFNNY